MYNYIIFYAYAGGNGRCFIAMDRKLDTQDTIMGVEEIIMENTHLEDVILTNFKELREIDPPDEGQYN